MKNSYLKSFSQFFSANFIVRFISLIREVILAWVVGPSKILDIFFFITTIPNLVNATWNKAIETVLLTKYEIDRNNTKILEAKYILAKRLSSIIVISFFVYIILSITFPIIMYFFYENIFSKPLIMAIFIVNITFLVETYIIAIKIVKFSEHNFFLPSIIPAIQSLLMIVGIISLTDKITVLFLALLYSVGSFLQLSILFKNEFSVLRKMFIAKVDFNSIKDIFKDSAQLSLAAGISSLNLFVDQSFALSLGESANSYIHYGNYFLTVYSVLFVKNINTIFFPQFQKFVLKNEHKMLLNDTRKIIKFILMFGLIIILITVNNGYYLLNLMLGHGKVNSDDIRIIYYCTLGYSGAFFGMAINAILIRVLHVYMEYKIIIKVAVVNFISNVVLNYILLKVFGIWGLTLSTSITILLIVIIYFIYLKIKRGLIIIDVSFWFKKYALIIILLSGMEIMIWKISGTFIQHSLLLNISIFMTTIITVIMLFSLFKLVDIKKLRINFE